ncbi:O-antigen ligase family protein [Rubricoccus marinus]|uniref:O-antigen ligase family protein n=1 Tax=Rubricoccus marinus TaxID=716817 RepID=UPI00117B4D82|nr:O-antigen ligase family protein [Rubricoccus marinus]
MESAKLSLPPLPLAVGSGLAATGLLLAVLALAPEALPLLVVAGIGLLALLVWAPSVAAPRTVGLIAVSILSIAALGGDDGTDAFEVAFGVALLLYPVLWYVLSAAEGYRCIRTGPDLAYVLFLAVALVFGVGLAARGDGFSAEFRSDITTVLAFAMWLPAREVCIRHRYGPRIIATLLIGLGVVAAISAAVRLQMALSSAEAFYEVVDVRIASGEIQVIGALLTAMCALAVVRTLGMRVVLLAATGLLLGGLILAKSRGPWVAAAVALMIAGSLLPGHGKRRLVGFSLLGAALLVGGAIAVLGDELALIGIGLARRLFSISSAFTADVSLLNRYEETASAWREIQQSPILGHGWGAQVFRKDLIANGTLSWGFIHNGYIWLWHKVGILGLTLFLIPFGTSVLYGIRAATSAALAHEERAYAAASVGAVLAFAVLGLPSNPFAVLDQILIVTLAMALASGLYHRSLRYAH